MEKVNFKDWTLTKLDKAFGLKQIWDCELMKKWQNISVEITENDKKNILFLQRPLVRGGRAWNEVELENKFISPLILQSRIEDDNLGYFLERPLKTTIGDYELSGIVDGMIATGFRDPDIPFFCMNEYKKSMDNAGQADGQVLASMLVAREMNENQKPIYGLYVVGLHWNFIVLEDNQYCISKSYNAEDEEVFVIFQMLKALKQIIKTELM